MPATGEYFINQDGLLELATDSTALSPSGLPVAPSTTPQVRTIPSVFDIPAAPGQSSICVTVFAKMLTNRFTYAVEQDTRTCPRPQQVQQRQAVRLLPADPRRLALSSRRTTALGQERPMTAPALTTWRRDLQLCASELVCRFGRDLCHTRDR